MLALYKYNQFLEKSDHQAFDQVWEAAAQTQYSGVFRCEGCGRWVTSVYPHPLPPQNHHQHLPQQGRIRWRLIVSHE